MTVLPTVRSQLREAAEWQASTPKTWPRPRFPTGALVSAAGVAVAFVVAILAVVLLGHHATATRTPAVRTPAVAPGHQSGARRLLEGNGIDNIHFGATPTTVDSGLTRLFGSPQGGSYVRSICGFDHASYWFGLDVRPKDFRGVRLFRATLIVYFKRSRFVGYVYNDDQAISRSPLQDETHLPLNSPQGRQALHGPRLTLATTNGLVLGDPLTQARRLYGPKLVETTTPQGTPPNPRLERLPIWEVGTPNGRISGAINNATVSQSFYGNTRQSIGSIAAGQAPNTPCH